VSLRIVWSSNVFWANTGYGIQARYLLPRLQRLGHAIAQFAWYGVQGGKLSWGGLTVYPAVHDPWGNDVAGAIVQDFRADLFVSLMDIWVLPADYRRRLGCAWAPWFPVDHKPIPPLVAGRAKTADYPLVYSRFGLEEARAAGIPARYIPHGVETSIYCPPEDKRAVKRLLGFPEDCFLIDMVAANKGYPSRKHLGESVIAFNEFRKRHEEAVLYLHTDITPAEGGLDLQALVKALGIPKENIYNVDQFQLHMGIPDVGLAKIYQAADVHLSPSSNEGFGIPIVEAQACGTPVITTNWTSMPELTFSGVCIEPMQLAFTPLNSFVAQVAVRDIVEALEEIYSWDTARRAEEAAKARAGALAYDWDKVTREYWKPFLEEVEDTLQRRPKPLDGPLADEVRKLARSEEEYRAELRGDAA